MQRKKIDVALYSIWLMILMVMYFFLFTTWLFYQVWDAQLFKVFMTITIAVASVHLVLFSVNLVILPLIHHIYFFIDKKRNPEKYKRIAEINREIDKMMTELDEEIDKIIKEKNDGEK